MNLKLDLKEEIEFKNKNKFLYSPLQLKDLEKGIETIQKHQLYMSLNDCFNNIETQVKYIGIYKEYQKKIILSHLLSLEEFIIKYCNDLDLTNKCFKGLSLKGANFEELDFTGSDFSGCDLKQVNFKRANLSAANLQGANLEEANLFASNLNNTDLRRSNLKKAELREVSLEQTSLRGAELYGALLWKVDLSSAFTNGVDLSRADRRGT